MTKIFISQRRDKIGEFNEVRDNLDSRFLKIFQRLKITPILIPNNILLTKKLIHTVKISGIILSPGGDARKKDVRYNTELLLLDFAYKKNIPLIGICRGAQAINIYFGGKIKKIVGHVRKNHKINSDLIVNKEIKTKCFHQYGVKKNYLGKNLEILGKSDDESIEWFRHKNKKIMGMMWHPERFTKLRSFELKIIKNFF